MVLHEFKRYLQIRSENHPLGIGGTETALTRFVNVLISTPDNEKNHVAMPFVELEKCLDAKIRQLQCAGSLVAHDENETQNDTPGVELVVAVVPTALASPQVIGARLVSDLNSTFSQILPKNRPDYLALKKMFERLIEEKLRKRSDSVFIPVYNLVIKMTLIQDGTKVSVIQK